MEELLGGTQGVDSGTTIIAVVYDGGVVLGADSRTSTGARGGGGGARRARSSPRRLTPPPPSGSYVANRVSDKLTALSDSIYCCRSGSAADTQALADYARLQLAQHAIVKGSPPTVAVAAKLFRSMCYSNKDRLLAGIIVAGWDARDGGSVFEIPLGGTCVRHDLAVGGSGSSYIMGFVDSAFRKGMSKADALAFVRAALAHAMARDGSSGGVIRTVTIDAGGVTREFVAGDKLPFALFPPPPARA